jgi:hypothetical protein
MMNGRACIILSFNLLNWGVYGAVGSAKIERVKKVIVENAPDIMCLSEVGPNDAIEQLTGPLGDAGLHYRPIAVGYPNSREIRNVILGKDSVEIIEPRLHVPVELNIPPIDLENFTMGGATLKLSREPLAALVRVRDYVLAIGFFHPKSKFPEDIATGKYPENIPNQTYFGMCKMISSLRNFGQCLLAREWVDRFWEYNPMQPQWKITTGDVHFALVGDWNANPQEEQRIALQGYPDAGLSPDTLLIDGIGSASTDMADICTIPWNGVPNSFDAILVDSKLGQKTEARIIAVDTVDLFGYEQKERDQLENDVLDHRPVGLFLK